MAQPKADGLRFNGAQVGYTAKRANHQGCMSSIGLRIMPKHQTGKDKQSASPEMDGALCALYGINRGGWLGLPIHCGSMAEKTSPLPPGALLQAPFKGLCIFLAPRSG